jgi:hypothetical protein
VYDFVVRFLFVLGFHFRVLIFYFGLILLFVCGYF